MKINAFVTKRDYFKKFNVFRVPLLGDIYSLFQLTEKLFSEGIAYAFPYKEFFYFKGEPNETLEKINEVIKEVPQGKLILSKSNGLEELPLSSTQGTIIKPIVYNAFRKLLELKGFRLPKRNIKKAIPDISNSTKREFIIPLDSASNIVVLRGLKYMFEVRPSGYGFLWLDVYSPPYNLMTQKFVSPKEVRASGLMNQYYSIAILKPNRRLEVLNSLLNVISNESTQTIELNFPDNDILEFSKKMLEIEVNVGEW
jgi:hypothetical protein